MVEVTNSAIIWGSIAIGLVMFMSILLLRIFFRPSDPKTLRDKLKRQLEKDKVKKAKMKVVADKKVEKPKKPNN